MPEVLISGAHLRRMNEELPEIKMTFGYLGCVGILGFLGEESLPWVIR